jgi:hypothetical protein
MTLTLKKDGARKQFAPQLAVAALRIALKN